MKASLTIDGKPFVQEQVFHLYGGPNADRYLGAVTATPPKPTLDEIFAQFHRDNPEIYATLVRLARAAKAKGRTRLGMKMLWEVMRWELLMDRPEDKSQREYALNNNYHSRYARMIMANEIDLAGIFETRSLKT